MTIVNIGVVQLHSTLDKAANVARAEELIREAAGDGADLVALPEYFSCYSAAVTPESVDTTYRAAAESIPGPLTERLGGLARELGICIHGGSSFERDGELIHNTSTIFGPDGTLLARYRKIHLFEATAPELTYHEGSAITPGEEVVSVDVPLAGESVTVGLSICYDVRFPEMYRILAAERGAQILFVPAAFPREVGRDHWELLMRARAVENQSIVVAPAQWGVQADGSYTHGRSLVVDQWGTVAATVPDGDGVAIARLDLDRLATYRRNYPNLRRRQPGVYASNSKEKN